MLPAAILVSAASADASARHRLDLPAGRLGDALVALGQQAGISVGVADPALANRRVERLRGRMTAAAALDRLTRGTGARAVAVDGRTWRVVRAPAPQRHASRPARREASPPREAEVEQADIVITASKRAFRLASFPGSVMFVSGEDPMAAAHGRGTEGLVATLPGLNSTHLGTGRNKLFIRGIADSSFNGPTQATVGQYLGETRLNYNTPDPNLHLHDIDRIEVLPGPQGTLYGAGSLGGILRIVPNAPRLGVVQGSVSIGAAFTQHGDPGGEAAAVLNLPIGDALALRVVGYGAREGGYIDDTLRGLDDVNRTDIHGGRARLRAEAGDWTIGLGIAGQRIRGRDGQFADRDAPPLTRASPVAEYYSNDYLLGDIVVERDWSNGLRFVSTAGMVHQTLDERYDSTRPDGPPTAYHQTNRLNLLSAESRLSRSGPEGTGWLIGASFISNRSEISRALGDPDAPDPIAGVRNSVNEITAFGEATIGIREGITATFGGRLTHSRLSGGVLDAPMAFLTMLRELRAQRDETVFLPSFALAARANDDLLLFARYQQGFRPGGLAVTSPFIARLVNGAVVTTEAMEPLPIGASSVGRFENDRVATIEVGARHGVPGAGRFDLAAAFAYTRWTDIQADIVNPFGFQTTSNIGDGRIFTLDLQVGWRPVAGLNLEAAVVLNDSLVTNPAPSIIITPRSPLPNVARVNFHLGAEYSAEIAPDAVLRLWSSARYAGTSRLGIGPILGEKQGDWLDLGAGARLERGRHALTLGMTNLLDAEGNRFAMGSPFTLALRRQITPLRPRTLRVGWEVRF
ncbi:MAG: TonB-dependent receptor [Sphingomonas sp.]|nr:TonB-dependent receptor [Sphingomonas sp.]